MFAKGYGLADVERGVAFSASRSLVRIASITKLFTWTAVMQQVETGRLDLKADVNRYLNGFQIPATYPKPVTLQTLMDHTAGFEDHVIGTGARTAADVPPLGEYLADNMPARVRPPGEISAYSNYGAALAGHIVSEVSGEPYDVYVRRHLLEPLHMRHSTAAEPVPAPLSADLARSYDSDATPPRAVPFTFDRLAPDGSISATAADMANFMIAHLRSGRFGDATILSAGTVSRMHERSFSAGPRLDGYAHGFKERTINGHRVLMHDGSWEGFLSALVLVPDCDLGMFISTNGTGGIAIVTEVMRTFFDRFAPVSAASTSSTTPDSVRGNGSTAPTTATAPYAGFYQPTRHNESTVEKLLNLLQTSRMTVNGDGTVRFAGKDWKPDGKGLYREAGGTDRLTFVSGHGGRRYVATDGPAYQLTASDETPPVNLVVLLVFGLAALSASALPLAGVVRRIRRRPATTSPTWRAARTLAAGSALAGFAFLMALAAALVVNGGEFLYGVPLSFSLLLAIPIVVLIGTVAAVAFTIKGWRGSRAGVAARSHQITLLTGLATLAWFLWQWHLVGWQFS